MQTITIKFFIREKWAWIPISSALAVNVFIWVYLAWFIRPTDSLLILHYTVHFGVDFLGRWVTVFQVPLIGFLFLLVNTALAWWFWNRIRVLSYVLNVVSVVIQTALIGVAVLLVFLNT